MFSFRSSSSISSTNAITGTASNKQNDTPRTIFGFVTTGLNALFATNSKVHEAKVEMAGSYSASSTYETQLMKVLLKIIESPSSASIGGDDTKTLVSLQSKNKTELTEIKDILSKNMNGTELDKLLSLTFKKLNTPALAALKDLIVLLIDPDLANGDRIRSNTPPPPRTPPQ